MLEDKIIAYLYKNKLTANLVTDKHYQLSPSGARIKHNDTGTHTPISVDEFFNILMRNFDKDIILYSEDNGKTKTISVVQFLQLPFHAKR